MDFLQEPWFWLLFAAASEIIALNPKLKSNSVVQLVLQAIKTLKPNGIDRKKPKR